MSDTLPVYPDLHTYADIASIEEKCRKAGHLDPSEGLLDRIKLDEQDLMKYGLTKDDIFTNHWNMYMKVYRSKNNIEYDGHADELFKEVPKNFGRGWCGHGLKTNDISLNGQNLRISHISWGGAEECPIERSFSNKYHGYQRGDRDWFVSNLDNNTSMWIPDLLPSQIGMFGFFQSPSSPYRLNLERYVKVMGLDGPVKKLKSHKKEIWDFPSGPFSKEFWMKKSDKIIKEIDDDNYHAILIKDNDRENLLVMFKDAEWIDKNKGNKIDIFGLPFDIEYIFNQNGYLNSHKIGVTILDDE